MINGGFIISKKDGRFFGAHDKSLRLYGLEPIWLVTLKVGLTGLVMSFFIGLFTFVDQLMLVNFMPITNAFNFTHLFYANNTGSLAPLLDHLHSTNKDLYDTIMQSLNNQGNNGLQALATAISNTTGLAIYTSVGVVRSAVSLTGPLSIIVNAIPSLFAIGTSVKYTHALGVLDHKRAALIWQNAFIGCILSGLVCFVLLLILVPSVLPLQASNNHIDANEIANLLPGISKHFHELGWNMNNVFVINGSQINEVLYYTTINNHAVFYVHVTNNQYLNVLDYQVNNIAVNAHNLVTLNANNLHQLVLPVTSTNSFNVVHVWNNYYMQVRNYSINWGEQFMFIMGAGCTIFALATLLGVILRSDGVLVMIAIITVLTVLINILFDYILIYYAQIGMSGAAVASVLGWGIEFVWYALYLQYSNVHSCADFKLLCPKCLCIRWAMIWELILFGLSMLIGTVTFSTSRIILFSVVSYVTVQVIPQVGSEYYLSILGACAPIINLFVFTVFGLIKGSDPIFAYNYSSKKYKRVREAYWYNMLMILVFSCIVLGLIGFCDPIKDGLLSWFKITANSPNYQQASASKLIWVWLMQVPIMSFATGGMFIYRSCNRLGTSYIVALIRSCVFNIPFVYIFMAIAINDKDILNAGLNMMQVNLPYLNHAMWFYMDNVPIATAGYALTVFIMSTIFVYTSLDDEPMKKWYQLWPTKYIYNAYQKHLFNEARV